jgi:hypothetical protein
MFHVDAQNNTSIDTNTTPPDTVGLADDVIVGMEGNVGIGVFPEAGSPPLILTGGGTPSIPKSPLRIEDGNQQEGRVLTSNDAYGNASWQDLPAGFASGRVYGFRNMPAQSFPTGGNYGYNAPVAWSFKPEVTGKYLFELRWWGKFKGVVSMPYVIFYFYKGQVLEDIFEQYVGANASDSDNVFSLCLTFYGEALNTTDVFTLRVYPASFHSARRAGAGQDVLASPEWAQSKMNILRID